MLRCVICWCGQPGAMKGRCPACGHLSTFSRRPSRGLRVKFGFHQADIHRMRPEYRRLLPGAYLDDLIGRANSPTAPEVARPDGALLTEAQAAEQAGVSAKTIRRLIDQKRLPAADYGTAAQHNYRIDPADLSRVMGSTKKEEASKPSHRPSRRQRRSTSSSRGSNQIW